MPATFSNMLTVNQRLKTGAVGFPFEKVPYKVENCPPSNMEVDKGLPQQDSSLPTPFRQLPCLLEGVVPLTGRLTRARPKVQRCVAQTSCLGAPSAGGKAHCSQKQSPVPSAEQILPPSKGVVDLRVRVPFEDSYSGGGLERKPAGKFWGWPLFGVGLKGNQQENRTPIFSLAHLTPPLMHSSLPCAPQRGRPLARTAETPSPAQKM